VLALTKFAPVHRAQTALAERAAAGEEVEAAYATAGARSRKWGVLVTVMTVAIAVLMVWKPALW